MIRLPSIVRLPKQKQFQYPSRYYSEANDAFEKLHKTANKQKEVEYKPIDHQFKGAFRSTKKNIEQSYFLRLVAIIITIIGVIAGWWFSN